MTSIIVSYHHMQLKLNSCHHITIASYHRIYLLIYVLIITQNYRLVLHQRTELEPFIIAQSYTFISPLYTMTVASNHHIQLYRHITVYAITIASQNIENAITMAQYYHQYLHISTELQLHITMYGINIASQNVEYAITTASYYHQYLHISRELQLHKTTNHNCTFVSARTVTTTSCHHN